MAVQHEGKLSVIQRRKEEGYGMAVWVMGSTPSSDHKDSSALSDLAMHQFSCLRLNK